ncbi:MAG: glycosyltransferase [Leptospiraceae bacterium]|nr:glycosyltransferase [Leptospiraceae bacterium]MCP5498712.1 glycosyltransferase [Leptospiraceae bacterium]
MKVAVVHDWLTGMRGGELVLDSILKIYPEAEIFTLIYNKGKLNERIENRTIHTAFTDRLPFKSKKYRSYLPLFPTAIESLDLRGFDLVISSSHCVAKGIIPETGSIHISYIHSPMRYIWDLFYDYFPRKKGLKAFIIQFISNYLRTWDIASSQRVDLFVSNSSFISERIRRFYNRKSVVVFPPCLPGGFSAEQATKSDYYLVVSAFAPYKRIDLAIEAFKKSGKKLIIIGSGQDEKKLRKNSSSNITFLSHLPREKVLEYYKNAKAFIFPGVEDFGIAPVEAQAYCTPVIAYGKGGALETVIDGKTGVFFYEQNPEAINKAIEKSDGISYKKEDFQKSIDRFTEEKFINDFKFQVDRLLRGKKFRESKSDTSAQIK